MGWMPWKMALEVAIPLLVIGVLWRPAGRRARIVTALCREGALVMGLYALWNLLGTLSLNHVGGAMSRGRSIWDIERALGLPSEVDVQKPFLDHDLIIRAFNQYYAWVHVPALGIFLIWLFLRHRDVYPTWRTSLALLTLACFVIQLVPVAPPRMFPGLGFVDTGHLYGDSVYGALRAPGPAQLSAMPSVHVAWAVLIGWVAYSVSTSRWRWIAVAHAGMTILVVTATANHWWLDGIVAAALLVAIRLATHGGRALARALPALPGRTEIAPGVALVATEPLERSGP